MPELPELDKILHSGQLAAGKYTIKFENDLKDYFSVSHILVTSTFNTAISVAITSCEFQDGDEVIA